MKVRVVAGSVAFSLALSAAAFAQAPGATGQPRSILPQRSVVEELPAPAPAPDADMPEADAEPQAPPRRPNLPVRGPAIEVGTLGNIEGPVAGLLDDNSGGLGNGMWQGIDRATAITLLKSLPPASSSEAQRLIVRKLLLTSAPPPTGAAEEPFNAVRITRLINAGLVDEAADLALRIDAPNSAEIVRAQANALILAGREEMCGDMTKRRLDSAEPFWAELRAYCYAVAGNTTAFDLTRAVIDDQGIVDPAFLVLLDGVASGKGTAPEVIRLPDALQLMMMQKLKLPIPREMESELGLPASLAAAASRETPKEARVAAAEKAMRAGLLPTPLLSEILDTYTFTSQSLNGAPAIARNEPLMSALARIRAALKLPGRAEAKAELIHSAFEVGQRDGVLGQVAILFANDAAAIFPSLDWTNWADLMVRGLLLAGQSDAAARWTEIVSPDDITLAPLATRLQLTLALAAPDVVQESTTQAALSRMGVASSSTLSRNAPGALGEAALTLGLFDALERPMPVEADDAVESLLQEQLLGRRADNALMQRAERSATSGGRGQTALAVVAALGIQGVRDLSPIDIVRLVRALRVAGIRDAADALAMEAMLLRPAAGY